MWERKRGAKLTGFAEGFEAGVQGDREQPHAIRRRNQQRPQRRQPADGDARQAADDGRREHSLAQRAPVAAAAVLRALLVVPVARAGEQAKAEGPEERRPAQEEHGDQRVRARQQLRLRAEEAVGEDQR